MKSRLTLKLGAVVAVALVAVLAVGGWRWWQASHRSTYAEAVSRLPADTLRASWTDWAQVRERLGADDPVLPSAQRAFLDMAFTTDLSAASTIEEAGVALQEHYGFSPATAEWEIYGQSRDGAVMELGLADDYDFDALADRLDELGYQAPEGDPADGGVWNGGVDLLPTIDPTLTPELQYVALLPDQGVVLTSDTPGYLATAVQAATGDGDGLEVPAELVEPVDEPSSAVLFTGTFACESLAMSQADPATESQGEELVTRAGGVAPIDGLLVARLEGERLRVVMGFASEDQARDNAESRATLAAGEAPGKGSVFTDLFTVEAAESDGGQVILDLEGRPRSYALSQITAGPVLFETC